VTRESRGGLRLRSRCGNYLSCDTRKIAWARIDVWSYPEQEMS
jgi:hypothetical protein